MHIRKRLILPTKQFVDAFYRDTVGLDSATYEMEYVLSKLIECLDEARACRGMDPASHQSQELFVQSVYYDGLADYHEGEQDIIFTQALCKLYRGILSVLVAHDHLFSPDEGMTMLTQTNGDIILATFDTNPLTPNQAHSMRSSSPFFTPGSLP